MIVVEINGRIFTFYQLESNVQDNQANKYIEAVVALRLGGRSLGKKQFMANLVDTQNDFLKNFADILSYLAIKSLGDDFFLVFTFMEAPLERGSSGPPPWKVGGGPGQIPHFPMPKATTVLKNIARFNSTQNRKNKWIYFSVNNAIEYWHPNKVFKKKDATNSLQRGFARLQARNGRL